MLSLLSSLACIFVISVNIFENNSVYICFIFFTFTSTSFSQNGVIILILFRRTGTLRTAGAMRTSARHNPARSKRKPPRGMHLNYDDLVAIVNGPSGEGDTILRSMDSEIVSFKRQVFIFKTYV